jgi:predicted PurR-regulated permease PerM
MHSPRYVMPQQTTPAGAASTRVASALVIVSFVLALLYLGRAVLEPLAIAALLGFILAPPIRRLRQYHVGRVSSVIIVVVLALAVIGALGFLMETQIARLAGELPQYQSNLSRKISSFNSALVPSGALKRASTTLNSLAAELKDQRNGSSEDLGLQRQSAPIAVTVQSPQPETLDYLQNVINPLLTPLTMTGLVILFLVFILFYREDLRDRVLRLAGTRDLQRTTAAMNDAGERLSQFFLIQSAINGSFGVFIGIALWAIGVPNPILWGMLAAILRFVPYVGTPIAAVFPLVLASAIDPGWTMALATAAVFFGGEIITGQAIEPVLQGQHTGLSPVAIVIATLFWTLIWGAPGLLLAVPITVCIAVLGKHIDALNFLGILLGDEPALAPQEGFYQRVLAGDATEATFQAEERLATEPLSNYYDAIPMKALALAQADAAEGKLSKERQVELCDTIAEIVDDLADYSDEISPAKTAIAVHPTVDTKPKEDEQINIHAPLGTTNPILLAPARSPLDQSASMLLAHILKKHGLEAVVQAYAPAARGWESKPTSADSQIVCISYFGASQNPVLVRYVIRRLRRVLPDARFVACFWLLGADPSKLEDWRNKVGAEFVATSLKEAADICQREAMRLPKLSLANAERGHEDSLAIKSNPLQQAIQPPATLA